MNRALAFLGKRLTKACALFFLSVIIIKFFIKNIQFRLRVFYFRCVIPV